MLFLQMAESTARLAGGCIEARYGRGARRDAIGQLTLHHFSLTADEASEEGMVVRRDMDIFMTYRLLAR